MKYKKQNFFKRIKRNFRNNKGKYALGAAALIGAAFWRANIMKYIATGILPRNARLANLVAAVANAPSPMKSLRRELARLPFLTVQDLADQARMEAATTAFNYAARNTLYRTPSPMDYSVQRTLSSPSVKRALFTDNNYSMVPYNTRGTKRWIEPYTQGQNKWRKLNLPNYSNFTNIKWY